MNVRRQCYGFFGTLLSVFLLGSSQEEVKKPTFPDVFQVEVEGLFVQKKAEVDGSLFYDKVNNKAATMFTYQGVRQKSIYNFDDDEYIQIEGNECQVSKIEAEAGAIFFPYTMKDNKKIMANPEEVFYFTNSTLYEQGLSVFPSYLYTAKLDFPLYGRTGCDVTHRFSKPEEELPDCDSHACRPTLQTISVRCPEIDEDNPFMEHTYNFFRFKGAPIDPEVFQAPEGIHCSSKSKKVFPEFPEYFSFAYDLYEDQEDKGEVGLYAVHKRVWYDSKLKLIRMDEFDNDGLIISSRILDFYGGIAYTVVASLSECVAGSLNENVSLAQMTQLPNIFFKKGVDFKDAVYVGERKVQGVYHEVWSLSYTDDQIDALIVEEFYFLNILPKAEEPRKLQISHTNIYVYERDDETRLFNLSVLSRLAINNFRSLPKEWEAFDVSSCFGNHEKKAFLLKVEGPPTVKESRIYEEILEKMYMQLISATKVSVVRISELSGIFNGDRISQFTGWILNKTQAKNSETGKLEPDMDTAYRMIVEAANAGKLSFTLKKDGKDIQYVVTAVEDIVDPNKNVTKPTFPDVFQVEVQGIFLNKKIEVDGSLFYDKVNNRAAIRFMYQGVRQKAIYNFDDDEYIQIEGNDCQVSKIDPNAGAIFFPFTMKGSKKIMANPDVVFYFTNSILDRQELSVFPSYVYAAKLDFPFYKRTNCDVTHIFSKPEVELPDCEGHACRPTLVAISVRCPEIDKDTPLMEHTYNFYRFRGAPVDPEVFQAPEGIHCSSKSTKVFPEFPQYFSFAYDLYEDHHKKGEVGLDAVYNRLWYDSKLKLLRVDEFDSDGLLNSSRILDFYGGTDYKVISSLSECLASPLNGDLALDQTTQLPKIFFKKNLDLEDALYVGQRNVQGVYYEVWSLSYTDDKTDAMIVEEFHFLNILPNTEESTKLQISHVNSYTYQKNDKNGPFKLSAQSRLTINNFRSQPKEWGAFDVSSCFGNDEKRGFKLKVEGPPTVKDSRSYEEILEKMYMRLIITTNVSVIRINELTGIFDGVKISEFTGWILNKTQAENSETGKLEPDMHTAYRMIEDAANAGKLSLKMKKDGKDIRYVVTSIEDITIPKNSVKDCFSGASLAAASLVLLVLGFSFGVVGYYVFLKRRRSAENDDDTVQLNSM